MFSKGGEPARQAGLSRKSKLFSPQNKTFIKRSIYLTIMTKYEFLKEKLQALLDKGYIFTISGVKSSKTICLVKNNKAIALYKGYWQNGQQWQSLKDSFIIADKITSSAKKEGYIFNYSPSDLRSQ